MSGEYSYEEREDDEDHEALGRPFRVRARLYNNRLIKARLELGFASAMKASQGLGISVQTIRDYEKLARSPVSKETGDWNQSARELADALGYSPEDLWPDVIFTVKQRYMELEAGSRMLALDGARDDLAISAQVQRALKALPPRERDIIEKHYGLDGKGERTLAEIGGVSRERLRQIELRGLRKLRVEIEQDERSTYAPDYLRWKEWCTAWLKIGKAVAQTEMQRKRRLVRHWKYEWGQAWAAIGRMVNRPPDPRCPGSNSSSTLIGEYVKCPSCMREVRVTPKGSIAYHHRPIGPLRGEPDPSKSSSEHVDRSFSALLERARKQVPRGFVGLAFNFHNGCGWYLLRAESADEHELIDQVRVDAERAGKCVAIISSDGKLLRVTQPCTRRHDAIACDGPSKRR